MVCLFVVMLMFLSFELIPRFGNQELPTISPIYFEIKNNDSEFAILDVPIIGDEDSSRGDAPSRWYSYYQFIHEKPIISASGSGRDFPEIQKKLMFCC